MTSLLEPVAAGIAVAIFNKYILNKIDPLGWCYTHCCEKEEEEEEEEEWSSSTSASSNDACHVHHF